MLNAAVLILFFALLGVMILGKREYMYVSVLAGVVVFPTCVYFVQKPQLSPQQAFVYLFFAFVVFRCFDEFKEALLKIPVLVPLFCLAISLMFSAYASGEGGKGLYNAARYFMENYSFWVIAFFGGFFYKDLKLEDRFAYPALILLVLGLMESVLGQNYIFKIICSAFPYYDGYYDLNGFVSASRSYRSRIFITTIHPTTLGAMLCCSLVFLLCFIKKQGEDKNKMLVTWGMLFLLVVLSGSRTGLACTLLGIAVYAFMKMKIGAKIICIVALFFAVSYYAQSVIEKLSVEGQGSSLTLRQEQLLFSYLHFAKSPIFGNGVRYTSKYVMERDTYNDRVTNDEIGGLESVIFFQLIDYGLVGLASYLLLYIIAFIYFFRRRDFVYARAGLLITVSFFAFACLSGEIGGNNSFAYLLMGFCMGATYTHEKEMDELESDEKPEELTKEEAE